MLTPFTHTTISSFSSNITSLWLIDSATSNHMTDSPTTLHDVCKYDGKQHIQITDGCTLPITTVGNLGSSLLMSLCLLIYLLISFQLDN
jgi:hypothetical protein